MEKIIEKPILFIVFNRPEKTQLVWNQIRKAKPKKLYISSDAPRLNYPGDFEKVVKVRKIVTEIDWQCDVKYLFHDTNLGCAFAGKTAFDWVFSQEEEMIELEDDVVPTQSFFWFMQEMLNMYRDNTKICYICAENYGIKSGEATYFYTQACGSWGWATWKRVYDLWEYKLESLEDVVNRKDFKKTFPSRFQYRYWKKRFIHWKYIGGNTYDLQTEYLIHKFDLVNIVPNINLVTNIGWDQEASNTVANVKNNKFAKKFGNIPSFEIAEIIHPKHIVYDSKITTKWFKYHYMGHSRLSYELRWLLGPLYRKLFK